MTAHTILSFVVFYLVAVAVILRLFAHIRHLDRLAAELELYLDGLDDELADLAADLDNVDDALDHLIAEYIDNLIGDALDEADE